MLVLLSPSKSQNFSQVQLSTHYTQPKFQLEIQTLIHSLKDLSLLELSKLMSISQKLADLNFGRIQSFAPKFTLSNAKPALFAFEGDVYTDIDVQNYSDYELEFANNHLRILSGLYGILKPLELIQPYRLEMKTKLKTQKASNLYEFWNTKITDFLNSENPDFILNLASEEYFKVIQPAKLKSKLITATFKENKQNNFKIIPIYAKKARGTMANYIVKNQITDPEKLKQFDLDNYRYNQSLSTPTQLVFTR